MLTAFDQSDSRCMEIASLITLIGRELLEWFLAPFLYRGTTSAALQSSGTTPSSSDFLNIMHNGKLISSDNAFSTLLCIPSIPSALFSFKFLNFFSTMGGSISVSISLEPFLSSNCCMGFHIDSIFSLVKTELKELFRIFALFLYTSILLFVNILFQR